MSSEKRATGALGRRASRSPSTTAAATARAATAPSSGTSQGRARAPVAAGRRTVTVPAAVALERGGELGGGGEAVGGQLGQRGEDRVLDGGRHAPALGRQAGGVGGHHLGHDGLRGGPGERRLADQHLVGDGAEGVHVGAGGDGALAHGLLGRHVVRRAERHAGLGHPAAAARAGDGQRDAEVGHQRAAVVQQDVLGLDVAVDHPVPVGVVEGGGHLGGQAHRVAHRQLFLPAQPVAQRLAVDERHDVVRGAVHLAAVDQAEDVRVLQRRDGLDLTQEALGADDGGQLGTQHLDGHLAPVLEVLGEVDRGHAALAQLALEAVAVGDQGLQPVNGVGQMGLSARDDRTRLKLASA